MAEKVVLMSIMTKHSNKIFEGTKLWEFRKAPPKISSNDRLKIIVYSSKIEKAIVGEFIVEKILNCPLHELINETGYHNDPKAEEWFHTYYKGKELCAAIKVANPLKYNKPILLDSIKKEIPSFRPPQNFQYILPKSQLDLLIKRLALQ